MLDVVPVITIGDLSRKVEDNLKDSEVDMFVTIEAKAFEDIDVVKECGFDSTVNMMEGLRGVKNNSGNNPA